RAARRAGSRGRQRHARERDGRGPGGHPRRHGVPDRRRRGRSGERAPERRDRGGDKRLMHLLLVDSSFAEETWIQIVKAIVIFAFILGVTPMVLLLELTLMFRMQSRYGLNSVGAWCLLQSVAG